MEKIVVRKDILKRGHVVSSFIYLTRGKRYTNERKLFKDFGFREVMKKLFNEDVESDSLADSTLYQHFFELISNSIENDKFVEIYKIDEEFALQLDFNIYLYHLVPKDEFYKKIVPWYYSDSKMYIGDTWGEQDEEIIESIRNLSIIEFLKRYKGY